MYILYITHIYPYIIEYIKQYDVLIYSCCTFCLQFIFLCYATAHPVYKSSWSEQYIKIDKY